MEHQDHHVMSDTNCVGVLVPQNKKETNALLLAFIVLCLDEAICVLTLIWSKFGNSFAKTCHVHNGKWQHNNNIVSVEVFISISITRSSSCLIVFTM